MAGPVFEAVLELPRIVGLGFENQNWETLVLTPTELGLVTNLDPWTPTRSGSGLGLDPEAAR
jgi:hypothetical protein